MNKKDPTKNPTVEPNVLAKGKQLLLLIFISTDRHFE